jgi:DNA-binding TFAR19-related protein (PDSD5 family)
MDSWIQVGDSSLTALQIEQTQTLKQFETEQTVQVQKGSVLQKVLLEEAAERGNKLGEITKALEKCIETVQGSMTQLGKFGK